MRKLLLLSFALAAVGVGCLAWAADMPLKAPAAKAPPLAYTAGRTRMQIARVGLNYKDASFRGAHAASKH
jgi:hypothetical protein